MTSETTSLLAKVTKDQMELLNRIYSDSVNGKTISTSSLCEIVKVTTRAHEALTNDATNDLLEACKLALLDEKTAGYVCNHLRAAIEKAGAK